MRRTITALAAALTALGLFATPAPAVVFEDFEVSLHSAPPEGSPPDALGPVDLRAGAHPYALRGSFEIQKTTVAGKTRPAEMTKNQRFEQMPGLSGIPKAVPRCATADFLIATADSTGNNATECADSSVVGTLKLELGDEKGSGFMNAPVYNLEPPPGVVGRLGASVSEVPVPIELGVSPNPPYNVTAKVGNASQVLEVFSADLVLWGNPADSAHDPLRGKCLEIDGGSKGNCSADVPEVPLLIAPRACQGPLPSLWEADSWERPGVFDSGFSLTQDDSGNPRGFSGCGKLAFAPRVSVTPTTNAAESPTGLDFNLDITDEGVRNPDGIAGSDVKKAVVTLPEGMTINPSVGEGLGVCSPDDLKRETLSSAPGEGCPNSSKVGTVRAEFPIIDVPVEGSIFLATQDDPTTTTPGAENPFDSLIALYFVLKNTDLGAIAKLPVKVEPDPNTGQLLVTLDDAPQFPLSHFNAHLRTGVRSALVTPPTCGTYTTQTKLYPWSDPDNPRIIDSTFEVSEGTSGSPCPPEGVPPFHPDFQAGSINNNAGAFSPFNMRLLRADGEQNMTKFSSVLPPGVLGSLAGVSKCPDSAMQIARAKSGREELANPSCPANSLIGHTLAGAGVGSALTYVGGQIYLAGPYNGRPLSVIAITPAVAGPFDAGTVAIRLALTLNPKTAEVEVDGAASDPIPHILKGIVLKVRDLRVYVDRPNFTLNPTSCDESSAKATLFGSYINVLDPADDRPVDLATRFQAANCLNLGFKPKLALNLKGGTRRGSHPGLKAIYTPRPGDANIEGLVVRLPSSAFLEQAHIRTICTRVQFAADNCPKAAQYGYIRAFTPLLDEPLQGPVWLRSSDHKLPDLVFDLHGLVDVEVAIRIDSARGGIRATLEEAPDAPLSKVVLTMQGGKKGLIVNSRNLCARKSRANVRFAGQNGKRFNANPEMRPQCGKSRGGKRR